MAEVRAPDFDFEAACNAAAWSRRAWSLPRCSSSPTTSWVDALAQRFCVSQAPTCDLLCRAAHPNADFEAAICEAYANTCREAERGDVVQRSAAHRAMQ